MANEFKIKTGLLIGASTNASVTSIKDTSISITSDASSLLVTGKAVYDFHQANATSGYWTLDGSTLVPSDDSVDVQLSAIQIETDSGTVVVIDMDVSSAGAGVEESYAFNIDGTTIAKVYAEGNGSAGIQEPAFKVLETFYAESSVYLTGIAENSQSKALYYNTATGEITYDDVSTGGAGDTAIWGGITGTLGDQTDLNNYLVDLSTNKLNDASILGLTDTSLGGTIPDGSALVYNSDGYWEYGAISTGGSSTLAALTDVSIGGTIPDGSSLVYDSGGSYWTYGAGGGGSSYWTLDGSTLVPTDSTVDVKLGEINIDTDAGAVTLVDMDVSSATTGTEESYSFDIDGSTIAKVWSEAQTGGVLNKTGFVVEADYQYMGDPNTNGSWRFYVGKDASADMIFEKRISGTWTEKGRFE